MFLDEYFNGKLKVSVSSTDLNLFHDYTWTITPIYMKLKVEFWDF